MKGYTIRYSGSTWMGENPVKSEVNTLDKIFKLAENKTKSGGFSKTMTSLSKRKGKNEWIFNGNFNKYSSVFWIDVKNSKVANIIKSKLRQRKYWSR